MQLGLEKHILVSSTWKAERSITAISRPASLRDKFPANEGHTARPQLKQTNKQKQIAVMKYSFIFAGIKSQNRIYQRIVFNPNSLYIYPQNIVIFVTNDEMIAFIEKSKNHQDFAYFAHTHQIMPHKMLFFFFFLFQIPMERTSGTHQ